MVSQSYKRYGVHKEGKNYVYREWAPEAQYISIFGEFNGWKRGEYICDKVN
jgi:1,4-alpha-glucan branching enzyme